MRTFVALEPPEAVRDALERVQDALPPGLGRAVEAESLHLTLAFLGERPEDEVMAAHEGLEGMRSPALTLRLGGLGSFPGSVWAGVRAGEGLEALHAKVRSALHGAGVVLERRRFRPHVTLVRLGRRGDEARLAAWMARWDGFACPDWAVADVVLFRSTLRPEGAVHEELARYPLR